MLPIDADILDANIQDNEKNQIIEEKIVYNQSIKYHLAFSKAGILSAIVKLPPKNEKQMTYTELPRPYEDEQKITDLITTLGINGKIALLLHHEKRLNKVGNEIRYIHPFKFLGYIFTHPDLKEYMAVIFDDYFIRTRFVKDFAQTMDIYDLRNKLVIYLDDFANELGISVDKIKPFIDNREWEGLLRFLISY
ncbi:MAG: hypothetical protein KR126chlam4_00913 [Candidatus Anoxychlamydiales bacterium]|uniref:Uncharacterized protein n=1 Tax=marine sediment metagenome TaxID=412755 RepID=A0A0F9JGP1_9ZZZZ|nr:hypothetical protein [Candidatus Anoxychlamydiales bacterium]NGX41078.1 hypothetical protein [Candidatus Anoxychlamydiales bacterium]